MKECILNGSVLHLFVATLLTQRGAVGETSSLSPTRSSRRKCLLLERLSDDWYVRAYRSWGVPRYGALVL